MEILLIRHGQPERVEGAEGPADPPLTEDGRHQAQRLAAWLAHEPVRHVVTSTLRRASPQTLAFCAVGSIEMTTCRAART